MFFFFFFGDSFKTKYAWQNDWHGLGQKQFHALHGLRNPSSNTAMTGYVIDLQSSSANGQVSVGAKTAVRVLTDNSNYIRRFFISRRPPGGDASDV